MAAALHLPHIMNYRNSATADHTANQAQPSRSTTPMATMENFVVETSCADGMAVESLQPGAVVRVSTRHSLYHFLVLDAARRHVLVKGGTPFPQLTEARVEGSTNGGSMMKAGWVGVGFRLEISVGNYRVLTSPITSVSVDDAPLD